MAEVKRKSWLMVTKTEIKTIAHFTEGVTREEALEHFKYPPGEFGTPEYLEEGISHRVTETAELA